VATSSELAMYGLMLVLPLIGWGMLSAARYPIVLYGHTILAYGFFAMFMAHVGAILFHTLIVRDGMLKRMAPWSIAGTSARGPR
jgi:cytochrome b561